MTETKNIAIDFDGVIHDYKNPVPGRRMGALIEGAKEALERFRANGYRIISHTVRGTTEQSIKCVADWMNYFECPFDEITNIKPNAEAYIDDKGISFTSWLETIKQIF